MSQLAPTDKNQAEYEARLLATSSNLRRYLNQCIGVIQASQSGEMPEETAFQELDTLDEQWAKILVDDLAPKQHIIQA